MQTTPASPPPFNLLVLLQDLERSIRLQLVGRLRAAGYPGLTPAHGKVFPYIAEDGSRVADMARAAHITKQSMSDLVDLLEQQGYVHRQPDPSDHRAKLVCLTPLGRQVVNTAKHALRDAYSDLETVIGADGLRTLQRLLTAVRSGSLAPGYEGAATGHLGGHAELEQRAGEENRTPI